MLKDAKMSFLEPSGYIELGSVISGFATVSDHFILHMLI